MNLPTKQEVVRQLKVLHARRAVNAVKLEEATSAHRFGSYFSKVAKADEYDLIHHLKADRRSLDQQIHMKEQLLTRPEKDDGQ